MFCNRCGSKISANSKFCYKCGNKTTSKHNNKLKHTQKVCNRCGSKISNGAEICDNCGNKITNINTDELDTTENNTQDSNISEVDNSHIQSAEQETYNSQNSTPPVKTDKSLSNNKIILMCTILLIFVTIVALLTPDREINTDTDTKIDTSLDTNNTANTAEMQLTKTYTNEEEGMSFNYPNSWLEDTAGESENNCFIFLGELEGEGYNSFMTISQQHVDNKDFTLDSIKPNISKSLEDIDFEVQEIIDTKIDGIDALKATAIRVTDSYLITYYYTINENFYHITFFVSIDLYDTYRPILDAIMESYKITSPKESITYTNGLSEEDALEVAHQFLVTHPLYERTVTGDVEYQPDGYDYSTEGLYKINLLNYDGEHRFMWVDKKTGSVFQSLDDVNLITGEEFYNAMFVSAQNRDEIYFKGIKLSDYLGSSVDDVYDDFGPPTSGTDIDGTTYTSGDFVGYKNINFIYDKDVEIIECIVGKPKVFTYKGVTLDKSRDELIELLGTPLYEAPSTNDTGKTLLQFSMSSYIVNFVFKSGYNDTYHIELYLDNNKWANY